MFLLGLILLIVGLVTGITILWIIGAILLAVGLFGNGFAHTRGGRYWY